MMPLPRVERISYEPAVAGYQMLADSIFEHIMKIDMLFGSI